MFKEVATVDFLERRDKARDQTSNYQRGGCSSSRGYHFLSLDLFPFLSVREVFFLFPVFTTLSASPLESGGGFDVVG